MSVTNTWSGLGNLGRDPELRQTNSGTAVTSFSVACDRRRRDADGNTVKATDWIPVVAYGPLAETCAKYLKKGSKVAVSGRMNPRAWKDSNEVTHRTTEIVASEVEFL
jgi:single-strand DNA-binding protein